MESPHRKLKCLMILTLLIVGCFGLSPNVAADETVVYSTGFESDNGGYTVEGNALWEWGSPTTVGPSSAHSGSKCWGTDLNGELQNKEGYLVSPAIAIPAISEGQVARVRFYGWIEIPWMYSRGEFFVSSDGSNWQSLAQLFYKMDGGWQLYEFDVSDYAGGNVYLKWRCYVSNYTSYGAPDPGFYIDDLAITVYDSPGDAKIFTLEAQEDASSYASCPWIFPWDGQEFVRDNDIYSVARYPHQEQHDWYLLQKPLVERDGVYPLEVREVEAEISWTDMVGLVTVDHAEGVGIAPDSDGNISSFVKEELRGPITAINNHGENMVAELNTLDDSGMAAYSEDYVDLDFGNLDVSQGAVLFLRVNGFLVGEGEELPYIGPPAIVVNVQDENGEWYEVGRIKPRYEYSEAAFDLAPYLPDHEGDLKVRLACISHSIKYHEIDYAALYAGPQPEMIVNTLSPKTAVFNETRDVLSELTTADDVYVETDTGEKYAMTFDVPAQDMPVREFLFESEGYYIPKSSTYFVYTWNGSQWVLRDGFTFPGSDLTHEFDLSLFLPDPDGEYKVRVWQDYQYEPAKIDYAAFSVGSSAGTLSSAVDVRDNSSILSAVQASDNNYFSYNYGPYYSQDTATGGTGYRRDRFTDYTFTGLEVNIPPSSPPGSEPETGNSIISWTYYDAEGDPQSAYEVEVWTQPNGTGEIMWDPPVGYGEETSLPYTGEPLEAGRIYYVRVKFSDGSSWSGWQQVSVDGSSLGGVAPNSAPTDISLSTNSIAENVASGTTVGTLNATDPDVADSHTFTIVGGDTAAFTISGNSLKTATSFDYESKSSYSITVRATDVGELTFDKTFTIGVTNANEAPTGISLSGTVIQENMVSGITVGTLSSADPDSGDSFTYALVGGDTDAFAISGSSLKTATSFDYESKNSYSVTIQATDSGDLTFDETFTINVVNANEAPTDISLSSSSVIENLVSGTTIGTLSATDPDSGDIFGYILMSGDTDAFAISGNSLKTATSFDYESKNSYSVTIRVTDSGDLTFDETFTIGIINVNEAPTAVALSNSAVPEDEPIGTPVGILSTTDPDSGDTHTYTVVSGDTDTFGISGTDLVTTAAFDYETRASYSVTVRSTDAAGLIKDQPFTISITDVYEGVAPTKIKFGLSTGGSGNVQVQPGHYLVNGLGGSRGFGEGSVPKGDDGYQQVDISAVFEDGLNYFRDTPYNASSEFFIGRNGYVTFGQGSSSYSPWGLAGSSVPMIAAYFGDVDTRATSVTYNTQGNSQGSNQIWYDIDTDLDCVTITFDDVGYYGNHADKTNAFQIRLWDLGGGDFGIEIRYEAVEWISTDTSTTATAGWTAGDQTNYDELPQSGNNSAMLTLDTADDATNIDQPGVWLWQVRGGQVSEWEIGVTENSPAGTEVGPLTAEDADIGDTFTFEILDDAEGRFSLSQVEGNTTLVTAAGSSFDYEQAASHQIHVQATDSYGNTYSEWLTIPIIDVNESPTAVTLSVNTVDENAPTGTTVGTFSTTDPDAGDSFTYSIIDGDTTAFSISGNSLNTAATFDFETKNSYSVTVRATDSGGLTTELPCTITVLDTNDTPTASNISDNLLEDGSLSIALTDLSGAFSDEDPADSLQRVRIDNLPANAQLVFSNGQNIVRSQAYAASAFDGAMFKPNADWNGTTSFDFSVSDGAAWSNAATWTVNVTAINDAPSFTPGVDQTVLEDAGAQTIVGWASAISTGPANESAQAVSFAVSNDNNALFSVQPAIAPNGSLTFTPADDINGSATVTVVLSDDAGTADGGDDTADAITFDIHVTAVNDTPSFTPGVDQTVLEDAGAQTIVGWASAISTGPANESDQAVSFAVSSDNNSLFSVQPAIAPNGNLTFTPADDINGSATVTVVLSDDAGTADGGDDTADAITFDIHVTAINDTPSFTPGADQTVLEDAGAQTMVGWASAISTGPANESAQTVSFAVSNDNNALFSVQPAIAPNGNLTFTPADDINGSATVTVVLSDDAGTADGGDDTADAITFDIHVTAVNDTPSFTPGVDQTVLEDAGAQTVVGWASNISAGPANESDQVTHLYASAENTALFSVQPTISDNGTLTFTPALNAYGTTRVVIIIRDDGETSNGGRNASTPYNLTISITEVNDDPVVLDDAYTVQEDSTNNIFDVLANDSDVDDDEILTITAVTAANHGTAVIANEGKAISYEPALNYPVPADSGADEIVYTVSDGRGGIVTGTVSITVDPINDPPTITAPATAQVDEDETLELTSSQVVQLADVDSGSDNLELVAGVAHGKLWTQNTTAASSITLTGSLEELNTELTTGLLYQGDLNFFGGDSIALSVTDLGHSGSGGALGDSATIDLTVNAVNDSPDAVEDQADVRAGDSVTIDVLANDTDIEVWDLAIVAVGESTYGSVQLLDDDSIVYAASYAVTTHDSFTYTIADVGGLTDTCEVSINIESARPMVTPEPAPGPTPTPAPTLPPQPEPTPAPTTGDLCGNVYTDTNSNDTQDINETGIDGAVVELVWLGADGVAHTKDDEAVDTTTTGANGEYAFAGLAPSTYLVNVNAGAGLTVTTNNPATVNILSGTTLALDFGCRPVGEIRVQAHIERGTAAGTPLAGVEMTLLTSGPDARFGSADDVIIASRTTAEDGACVFGELLDNNYMVRAANVDGHVMSGVGERQVMVRSGQASVQPVFGYLTANSITVHTWVDPTMGGSPDPNSDTLPGATVTIMGAGPDGVLGTPDDVEIGVLTTDENGDTTMGNLPEGMYRVIINYPDGYVGESPAMQDVYVGEDGAGNVSFGAQPLGSVGGMVYEDANANGLRDESEHGLAGVSIRVYARSQVISPDAELLLSETQTDANGHYSFSQLALGNYVFDNMGYATLALYEVDPDGHTSTTPNLVEVTVTSKAPSVIDFGDTMVCKTTGTIWDDADGDGNPDTNETPLTGIDVSIFGPGPDGILGTGDDELVATALTNADGEYQFGGLPDGEYRIVPSLPDDVTCDQPYADITVTDGIASSAAFACSLPGSLSGTVYGDSDKNGKQGEGEDGMAGITVEIYTVDPATGEEQLLATTTTGADGSWRVTGLEAGAYRVKQSTPGSLECTTPPTVDLTLEIGDSGNASFGNCSLQYLPPEPNATIVIPLIFCSH